MSKKIASDSTVKYSMIKYGFILLAGFFIGRNYPDILNQVVVQSKSHSSLIIAVATVALVGATIWLALDNRKMRLAQDKPWLYFYLKEMYFGSGFVGSVDQLPSPFYLYVKNVGKGPAINIKFKVEQAEVQREALSPEEESHINEIKLDSELMSKGITIENITCKDLNDYERPQEKVILKP